MTREPVYLFTGFAFLIACIVGNGCRSTDAADCRDLYYPPGYDMPVRCATDDATEIHPSGAIICRCPPAAGREGER